VRGVDLHRQPIEVFSGQYSLPIRHDLRVARVRVKGRPYSGREVHQGGAELNQQAGEPERQNEHLGGPAHHQKFSQGEHRKRNRGHEKARPPAQITMPMRVGSIGNRIDSHKRGEE